jgi:hypothetical protein
VSIWNSQGRNVRSTKTQTSIFDQLSAIPKIGVEENHISIAIENQTKEAHNARSILGLLEANKVKKPPSIIKLKNNTSPLITI